MSEPDAQFTRIFLTLTRRYVDTLTFRGLARAGEPLVSAHASAQDSRLVQAILTDPEYDKYFLNRQKAVDFFGGPEAFRESLTQKKLSTFRRVADIASIVLMHSALDAALTDLCRLTALIQPTDWEPLIERQQVPLASIKTVAYPEVLRAKLDDHLDALERESLLKRADVLFQVCKPGPDFDPLNNYKYDRAEVERLDRLRHDLVHGRNDGDTLAAVDQAVEFLLKTGLFFWGMLNRKYNVRMDPMWLLRDKVK